MTKRSANTKKTRVGRAQMAPMSSVGLVARIVLGRSGVDHRTLSIPRGRHQLVMPVGEAMASCLARLAATGSSLTGPAGLGLVMEVLCVSLAEDFEATTLGQIAGGLDATAAALTTCLQARHVAL